ncbi:MAG: hypothetical protein ACR2OI_05945 [Acidimicrobiia bacterium]
MNRQRLMVGLALPIGMVVLAGCGSGSDTGATTATSSPDPVTTTTRIAPSSTSTSTISSSTAPTTTTIAASPLDLPACQEPSSCSHPMADQAVWELPVLSIRYLPDADADGFVDFDATGFQGTVEELRRRVELLDIAGAWWMTEATRYRQGQGEVRPSLGYRVVDVIESQATVPPGRPVPWNEGWFRPDYQAILSDLDLCRWVDGLGVREVWMWTQHHGLIEPAESNMWSPVGDISNSERTDDLPACEHSYTVYNYNFTRGVAEMLHNHGHQAEALFGRGDAHLFWDEFVGARTSEGGLEAPFRCGWTHTPPNGLSHYDTFSDRTVASDCGAWEPAGGEVSDMDCSVWFEAVYEDPACFDDGGLAFSVWWFQGVPGEGNGLSYQGKALTNWWQLFADLESAVDSPSWLLEG